MIQVFDYSKTLDNKSLGEENTPLAFFSHKRYLAHYQEYTVSTSGDAEWSFANF